MRNSLPILKYFTALTVTLGFLSSACVICFNNPNGGFSAVALATGQVESRAYINFCCPWGQIYHPVDEVCVNSTDLYTFAWPHPALNITQGNGIEQTVEIFDFFRVENFRPCKIMFPLTPSEWKLFSNGTLLRVDDTIYMQNNEYCFVPTLPNKTDRYFIINAANCNYSGDFNYRIINACAMLASIPFMVLTIAVYLLVPKLRNQHGKSLVCYLLGLIIGYAMLCTISLSDLNPSGMTCKIFAYSAYFSFMLAFFWLSVISFDLWYNFSATRVVNQQHENKVFIKYSIYAWGLAVIFLAFTWSAQELTNWPKEYKPSIGSEGFCWIDVRSWSAMIYFFGPIIVVILGNIVMFVLTAIKIRKVQTEMARITAHVDSNKSLRMEKDRFGLFLRLFILMGVTWSMEILSYFVGSDNAYAFIFRLPDLCNAFQGFLIFVLFVMKKKVKKLITTRYSESRDNSSQRRN